MSAKLGTGRSFFCAFIFAEGVSQGKASNCEADDFNDSAVHIRIKHANPLLPVKICRRATVTVEGVQNPSIHQMKHLTQRATAYRWWPSGAEMLPIFLLYHIPAGEGRATLPGKAS